MKSTSANRSVSGMIVAVFVGIYFAGYAVIRMQCTGRAPFLVVPSSTHLISIYKPLFYAERKLTGHHFSTTPWGQDVGF